MICRSHLALEAPGVADPRDDSGAVGPTATGMQETKPSQEAEKSLPLPDKIKEAFSPSFHIRSLSITGLFLLAVLYTFHQAADFILPVVLALLMSLLLLPFVRVLRKSGIPEGFGAAAAIILLIVLLLGLGSLITQPLAAFVGDFPYNLAKIRDRIAFLSGPLSEIAAASKQVEQLMPSNQGSVGLVALKEQSLLQILFSQTPGFLAKLVIVVVFCYFLLAHGEIFIRKTVKLVPTFQDKRRVVEIAREIESSISRYLTSVTLLNMGLGACVGIAAALLGMGNPIMWGGAAFLLNYIPFIGSACGIIFIGVASFIQFETVWYACLAPAIYFCLNALESNFVTPHVLGRWMTLNPVAIIISFLFWGWLWGVPGMLLAVPILAGTKIFCDHIAELTFLGEFLGE
jgi:predicted PurR-regulated permease PerM